jgi:hypothetical protein
VRELTDDQLEGRIGGFVDKLVEAVGALLAKREGEGAIQ